MLEGRKIICGFLEEQMKEDRLIYHIVFHSKLRNKPRVISIVLFRKRIKEEQCLLNGLGKLSDYMVKRKRLRRTKKDKLGALALEFKILQDQIKASSGDQIGDSSGVVRKALEKERDKVVKKYKKLKGVK